MAELSRLPLMSLASLGCAQKDGVPHAQQSYTRAAGSSQRGPALLAICSDLDETPDAETYFELMRFLNTTEETSMGTGVGLEVGNTIYFDMAPGQLSYWNTCDENREKIRALIRSGHIDCLHSFGDLATSRSHAGRALDELSRHGCELKVWIDHAQAITNFGSDIMQGRGDDPSHEAYHADLSLAYGIRHVWLGRVTSVLAQERAFNPFRLWGDLRATGTRRRRRAIAITAIKELVKRAAGALGSAKYKMHGTNRLICGRELRDGSRTREFIRSNPHYAGVSVADRGDRIDEVITERFLERLTARGGACILYCHLGKLGPRNRRFKQAVVQAFRKLSEFHHSGKLRVMTTRRLLEQVDGPTGSTSDDPSKTLSFPTL